MRYTDSNRRTLIMRTSTLPVPTRLELSRHMLPLILGQRMRQLAKVLGLLKPPRLQLEAVAPPPDSELARNVEAFLQETHSELLVCHGYRSYLFASALAEYRKVKHDRELVYVSCLLHDLGLTPEAAGDGAFELRGARRAAEYCLDCGMSEPRADVVHEAIAWHTAVGAVPTRSIEGELLQWGSGLDVIGLRSEWVHRATLAEILELHPRGEFKCGIVALLKEALAQGPTSSLHTLAQLGFIGRIRRAPFHS